jgi:hypothetical protein
MIMGKICSRDEYCNPRGWLRVRVPAAWLGLLLTFGPAAQAHRVEGYLQAALINLKPDRVELEIGITPGLEQFSEALRLIDYNHDNRISAQEWQLYAASVLKDLSLEVDHRRQPLTLAVSAFPLLDDLKSGLGTITLKLATRLPPMRYGPHHLFFRNGHQASGSDYLLNCLQPTNGIEITRQVRDYRQTEINLDFSVQSVPQSPTVTAHPFPRWLFAPVLLFFLNIVRVWRFPRGAS